MTNTVDPQSRIRNTPGTVSAKIFYINQTLEVFLDTHMSGTYQPCLFVPHLELKKGGDFLFTLWLGYLAMVQPLRSR